jgi:D-alanyl-D-alanine carboxypeptidase/D-alanyl-D-alanine-endopeptidase (penicillin-binding protein 4)
VAVDSKPALSGYRVPQPSRFAEIVFAEALHERGIVAAARPVEDKADIAALSSGYTADHAIAEHVSPPYAEEVKITLKVSHNLHASATPFLLGALVGHKGDAATGFEQIRKFLETTGADVTGASQSDGAGADAHFTPDFMVHYLAYMAKQPAATIFQSPTRRARLSRTRRLPSAIPQRIPLAQSPPVMTVTIRPWRWCPGREPPGAGCRRQRDARTAP